MIYSQLSLSNDFIKMRWKEPYVTQGLNMKGFGVNRPGIYSGFVIGVTGYRQLTVGPGTVSGGIATGYVSGYAGGAFDNTNGYSIAVQEMNNGYSTTIQIPPGTNAIQLIDASSAPTGRRFVVLRTSYAITQDTTGSFALVDGSDIDLNPSWIVIGYVDVPASGNFDQTMIGYFDPTYPRLTPLATANKAGLMSPDMVSKITDFDGYKQLLDIDLSGSSNYVITIKPSQKKLSGKRIFTYIQGSVASKFPRDASTKYNGGVNDDQVTNINIQTGVIGGAHQVPSNLSFAIPSIIGTANKFQVGVIALDATDNINVFYSASLSTLSACSDEDNIPVVPQAMLQVCAFIASTDAGGALNPMTTSSLMRRTPFLNVGGGSGSGSGVGDDLGSLQYKASFTDSFTDSASSSTSAVDYTTGKTDSSTLSIANGYHRLSYDASKTVTGASTSMTISATPSYTVKVGDVLVIGTEVKRITVVTSQTSYTIQSAFSSNPASAACTISQAVYTKDLNNTAFDGIAPSTAFSTSINNILVDYQDTTSDSDIIFDANTTPVIAYSASADGSNYSAKSVRSTNLSDIMSSLDIAVPGTNLYLRFFSNKTSGSGYVNVLGYKAFFHKDTSYQDGNILNQATCFTNGVGTPVNCSVSLVSGKTRVQTTWTFPVAVNGTTSNGSLFVFLNGSKITRYIDATLTPDGSYKEIDNRTIELDGDYSAINFTVEIVNMLSVVDVSDTNTTNISYLQEMHAKSSQNFVDESGVLVGTQTIGAPAAGYFYTTIPNRPSIPNITNNLKAAIGVERVITQAIMSSNDEYGPNGEPVWEAVNDDRGLIRFVGAGWSQGSNSDGQFALSSLQNDYCEFTFWGTGLNLLTYVDNSARDMRASVDGASEGSNLLILTGSGGINGRKYSANTIISVVSGLSPGVHTVKIRNAHASLNAVVFGFEALNESSTIKVNPGVSFANGKKVVSSVQNVLAYNSGFESGTLGTKGGRVAVYQKADGTIAKALTPTNTSALYLTNTNHTNEELYRTHNWREFGAGRADDFSYMSSTTNAAFTLDDGSTTLIGYQVRTAQSAGVSNIVSDGVGVFQNGSLSITFKGTGLDIDIEPCAFARTFTSILVDGVNVGSYTATSTVWRTTVSIASGLPYGEHVVKFLNTNSVDSPYFINFKIYQPKTPSIPAGANLLSNYNLLADYVQDNTLSAPDHISQGTVRKINTREFLYSGAWGFGSFDAQFATGFALLTSTSGSYFEIPFWGTGINFRPFIGNAAYNFTASIDGSSNLTGIGTFTYTGTGLTYAASTGTISGTASGATTSYNGGLLCITGLPLSLHKLRITSNNTTNFYVGAVDIITPLYSPKSNIGFDQQNSLMVGSNSLSDERVISPVKENYLQKKNVVQAVGIVSGPTTTSTVYIPMPDMILSHFNRTGKIEINYNGVARNQSAAGIADSLFQLRIDGVLIGSEAQFTTPYANAAVTSTLTYIGNVPFGFHTIDVCWRVTSSTMNSEATKRILTVKEI